MRNITLTAIFALFLVLGTSCKKDKDCIYGSGSVISRSINIGAFNSVSLYTVANIIITKDTFTSMVVEGQSNVITLLDIKNNQGHLSIGKDNCFRDLKTLRIYLTTPDLSDVALAGSGSISAIGMFQGPYFNATVSGSGNVNVSIDVQNFGGFIEGSGNISATGIAENLSLRSTGSGNFDCFGMPGKEGTVSIDGSSSCKIDVSDKLTVRITGSGIVYYKGNPVLDIITTGSGQVVKVN